MLYAIALMTLTAYSGLSNTQAQTQNHDTCNAYMSKRWHSTHRYAYLNTRMLQDSHLEQQKTGYEKKNSWISGRVPSVKKKEPRRGVRSDFQNLKSVGHDCCSSPDSKVFFGGLPNAYGLTHNNVEFFDMINTGLGTAHKQSWKVGPGSTHGSQWSPMVAVWILET